MEYGIVTAIDGIATVDICAYEVSIGLISAKCVCLVSRCVRPQHRVFVDVISVSFASAWMVRRESQRVEILCGGDDGEELVVVLEACEAGFDELPGDAQGMVFLHM
jgi:hypothetical protein